ncbi:MAG: ATP-binding cassette domain-containing protein [Pygmaiobacter massiliensis]|nr:ATP-binding cassette domain-containing protein [Pygmaiobacter massiliensis]
MIEIDHLTKVFSAGTPNECVALSDVTFTIEDGDIFGIIGMSGAGKSTLLRCLSLLETPTSGRIMQDGVDISTLKGKNLIEAHRKTGVVFQGYNLLMQKTVAENVAFPLRLAGKKKAETAPRVAQLLDLVGLADKADNYPAQLSGGQMQRVAIARALASDPKVLLCDEPTSALDSLTTSQMLDLLVDINRKLGITIVIITHALNVVRRICNKVAVIDAARYAEGGLTRDVFATPRTDVTRRLLSQADGGAEPKEEEQA